MLLLGLLVGFSVGSILAWRLCAAMEAMESVTMLVEMVAQGFLLAEALEQPPSRFLPRWDVAALLRLARKAWLGDRR